MATVPAAVIARPGAVARGSAVAVQEHPFKL